ncbi:cupin domain-containing protein [Natrarchaeobius sp. A-rgal3]|uniref:cupin domain-containing protein n=1 Tax=Natrarchaeobius versutus TaxID=1679078 RepID=UPI003510B5F4
MERVSIDDVDPEPNDPSLHTDRRDLTESLSADGVAIVRYVLAPGERFSGSIHAHADQEEIFVVLEGEATFELRTKDEGIRELVVTADEAVRFAPGEFQSGRNDGSEPLVALALGTPRETEDVRVARIPTLGDRTVECPGCDRDSMRISSEAGVDFECPDCGDTLTLE